MSNTWIKGYSGRPYPNVRAAVRASGQVVFHATVPRHRKTVYLGVFESAEEARRQVLMAQAEHLEAKAAAYRAEADAV